MSSQHQNYVEHGTRSGRTGRDMPLKRIIPSFFPLPNIFADLLFSRLDNLISRFEEPSSMVRWDSPLFSVPWTDKDIPGEDIWQAVTGGILKPPNAGTQSVKKNSYTSIPQSVKIYLFP
jgi:hypothetical protein